MSLPDPKTEVAIPTGADPDDYVSGADFNAVLVALTVDAIHAPSLLNSWANYGSGFRNAGYWKDLSGTVHLMGTITNSPGNAGGSSYPLLVLPSGYRPGARIVFTDGITARRIDVDANGDVFATGTVSPSSVAALDLILFRAE